MASSTSSLKRILEALRLAHPAHADKLDRVLPLEDPVYHREAENFLGKWFSREGAWPIERSLEAYLRLLEEMNRLQADYVRTGAYPHTSFLEVETHFYSQPNEMRRHLEALALAQFLWIDQWERFTFFSDWMNGLESASHLEIGPGHGLYLDRTVRQLAPFKARIYALDVSASSLESARSIAGHGITYIASDFLKWTPTGTVDSLTMGEVLEHVEDPEQFLLKARQCLHPRGSLFLSTPLHAPMPDHITAFKDLSSLREILTRNTGFTIASEHQCAVDRLPVELAQRFLKPIMYVAILNPVS